MSEAVKRALAEHHRGVVSEALEALESLEFVVLLSAPIREGLHRYLADRIETGSFLRAVLENDLVGAHRRAHPSIGIAQFRALTELFVGHFPQTAWGSKAKVEAWLRNDPADILTIEEEMLGGLDGEGDDL